MSTPHKQHNPGFLASGERRQIARPGDRHRRYKKMCAAGEPHVLIDTREDNEWAAGHAAGAIHLSKGIIERDIEAKVPDKDTSWCCTAAADSARRWPPTRCRRWATRNAISLDGGWRALQASGLPLEK